MPGNVRYTPASGTVLPLGNGQTLSVTFTPTDATDYTAATKSVSINVQAEQITPTITWSNPADIFYGTALSNHATRRRDRAQRARNVCVHAR